MLPGCNTLSTQQVSFDKNMHFLKSCVVKTQVTINNRIKAINNCKSHIENFILFVTAVLKQKDLETSLIFV